MRKTQFAAFLLSGLLVLNTAIPAFAEGMTQQAETYKVDTTAPVVTTVSLNKTAANAGETLTLSIEASDDVSGVSGFQAIFRNKKTGEEIWSHHSDDDFGNPLETRIEISEYEESGAYELLSVSVIDNANNSRVYHKDPQPGYEEKLPNQLSFTVTNTADKTDKKAPEIKSISINKTTVNAGETLTLSIEASDDVSGVSGFQAIFRNKKTGEEIWSHHSDDDFGNPLETRIEISEYEESGAYELLSVSVIDNANNSRVYHKDPQPGYEEELPNPLSFTVKNDDELVPGQSENRPNKPQRPSKPSHSGSSSGVVVNYDSEKPDPADKKAMEMYDFWQNVKRKIKNTEEGKTLRVAVPAEYTYMPASVMETLRLNPQVGLKLSWGKDTIVIKAGTAQPKQKLKAYWTKSALLKLYTQR